MTPSDVAEVLAYAQSLFPRCKWNEHEWGLFSSKTRYADKSQVVHAVTEHRSESKFNNPNMGAILSKLSALRGAPAHMPRSEIHSLREELELPPHVGAPEVILAHARRQLQRARESYGRGADSLWWYRGGDGGFLLKSRLIDVGATVDQAEHMVQHFVLSEGVDTSPRRASEENAE